MAVKKTAKTWAEISMIVVDFFTIFRLQLELCFPFYVFFFFFLLKHCAHKLFTRIFCKPGCQEAMK